MSNVFETETVLWEHGKGGYSLFHVFAVIAASNTVLAFAICLSACLSLCSQTSPLSKQKILKPCFPLVTSCSKILFLSGCCCLVTKSYLTLLPPHGP